MQRMIYNYLCMYSFIDNTQKKLYNGDRFYAVKQREGKNMDELNKHNIDDADTENCAHRGALKTNS